MKSGGESDGPLGGGFIEHHDLCFFMVDAHTASLCPVLAGVYPIFFSDPNLRRICPHSPRRPIHTRTPPQKRLVLAIHIEPVRREEGGKEDTKEGTVMNGTPTADRLRPLLLRPVAATLPVGFFSRNDIINSRSNRYSQNTCSRACILTPARPHCHYHQCDQQHPL